MAWKGRFSVKQTSMEDLQEIIDDLEAVPLRARRISSSDISRESITKGNLDKSLQLEISTANANSVRALSPLHMKGSIPKRALSDEVLSEQNRTEALAMRGNEPLHMSGSIPAAAADLTDDWSFKRFGLHAGSTITSSGTVSAGTASWYLVGTLGGDVTIGLPAAATCTNMVLGFKKLQAPNNMILDPDGSETIDGAATKSFSARWTFVNIISNGTNWFILSSGVP